AEARSRARRGEAEPTAGRVGDERRPPLSRMNRYGGEGETQRRRRIIAVVCGLVVVLVLFAMLGGC
ncbi:MAG: hypothetical protein ACXWE8_09780, partial [Solirubrobacterales bacterium]